MEKEIKIVICMIGQNVEDVLPLSLESVKEADAIVFVDGGSVDGTLNILKEKGFLEYANEGCEMSKTDPYALIKKRYEQEYKGANGRARNIYLKFIQKNFPDFWTLVLDPDEVIDDFSKVRKVAELAEKQYPEAKNFMLSPKMYHFIYDLTHDDFTYPEHFCIHRFFKVTDDLYYPELEHPTLICKEKPVNGRFRDFTIYHFGLSKLVFEMLRKYKNNLKKSTMHTKPYLKNWYYSIITGRYAMRVFDILSFPKFVKDHFMLDDIDDYLYFYDKRKIETRHFYHCIQWKDHFKPKKAIFCACGAGQRVWVMSKLGVDSYGFDKSRYIVENEHFQSIKDNIFIDDLINLEHKGKYDLVVCFDLLEHLEEKDLDKALENVSKLGTKDFLFSIPFKGSKGIPDDPNFNRDKTHKIFETREWWIEKFKKYGIKIIGTPDYFIDSYQIMIGKKNDNMSKL